MRVIEHILSTIAPHECIQCGSEGDLLCQACSQGLLSVPERCYRCLRSSIGFRTCQACRRQSALYSVRPVTVYNDVAKELIHKLKFEHARAAVVPITDLMRFDLPQTAVLTHVPTATSRVRQRGYDQSLLIARQLARHTGLSYVPLLTRLGQQRQVGKNRAERHTQMQELFLVRKKQIPKQIILVDDVITTGATLEACAHKLKEAGAQQVSAVVFAAA